MSYASIYQLGVLQYLKGQPRKLDTDEYRWGLDASYSDLWYNGWDHGKRYGTPDQFKAKAREARAKIRQAAADRIGKPWDNCTRDDDNAVWTVNDVAKKLYPGYLEGRTLEHYACRYAVEVAHDELCIHSAEQNLSAIRSKSRNIIDSLIGQ